MSLLPSLVVLRVVGTTLLDDPFQAGVPWPVWAAGLEPDASASDRSGWRRTLWAAGPGGRGWTVPALHFGDVVEFGSYREPRWRWFGWYTHYAMAAEAIIVTGPFASPGEAWADGEHARQDLHDAALADYRRARLDAATRDVATVPTAGVVPPHPAR